MAETKIASHFFKYNNLKYFRDGAENIEMCSFGEKKDPLGPKSYLSVEGKVARKHLEGRIKKIPSVDIDWSKQSKADVEANGLIPVYGIPVKVGTTYSYEEAKSADLKLIKFVIDEGPLKKMLNNDANAARNYLADEGKDGRIVSSIWVVMEGKLARHFDSVGSISANAAGSNLEITASGGVAGSQTITLSEGTTFAYAMHKVKKWNKGKTEIEDMEDDYHGIG
ncbi:MAG: hypothetical protein D6752_00910 [Candidatus Nitrosothermus koennekii]|nr:MAG: hypothetical protein D6752_00910 [Candidatus Nitrosothermus koennekii]